MNDETTHKKLFNIPGVICLVHAEMDQAYDGVSDQLDIFFTCPEKALTVGRSLLRSKITWEGWKLGDKLPDALTWKTYKTPQDNDQCEVLLSARSPLSRLVSYDVTVTLVFAEDMEIPEATKAALFSQFMAVVDAANHSTKEETNNG